MFVSPKMAKIDGWFVDDDERSDGNGMVLWSGVDRDSTMNAFADVGGISEILTKKVRWRVG